MSVPRRCSTEKRRRLCPRISLDSCNLSLVVKEHVHSWRAGRPWLDLLLTLQKPGWFSSVLLSPTDFQLKNSTRRLVISDVLYPAKLQSKPAALCFSSLGVKVAEELVLLVIVRSFSLCGSQWKRSWPLGSSSIWHFDLGVLSPMQSHPWRRQVVCVCVRDPSYMLLWLQCQKSGASLPDK